MCDGCYCCCFLLFLFSTRYLSVCLYLYLIVGPCYVATFSKVSLARSLHFYCCLFHWYIFIYHIRIYFFMCTDRQTIVWLLPLYLYSSWCVCAWSCARLNMHIICLCVDKNERQILLIPFLVVLNRNKQTHSHSPIVRVCSFILFFDLVALLHGTHTNTHLIVCV